jgi:hypothetical protein
MLAQGADILVIDAISNRIRKISGPAHTAAPFWTATALRLIDHPLAHRRPIPPQPDPTRRLR